MTQPLIKVGSLVVAKRASGVNAAGERGVCYEVYQFGGRPGYGILFEHGRYDGFSPEDVNTFLHVTGQHCPAVADYQFANVTQLARDFERGRFAEAFPPPGRRRCRPGRTSEMEKQNGCRPAQGRLVAYRNATPPGYRRHSPATRTQSLT